MENSYYFNANTLHPAPPLWNNQTHNNNNPFFLHHQQRTISADNHQAYDVLTSNNPSRITNNHSISGEHVSLSWPRYAEINFSRGLITPKEPPPSNENKSNNILISSQEHLDLIVENREKKEKKKINLPLIRGPWTKEEDRRLHKFIKEYGIGKWAKIAEKMNGRSGKQCRERWINHLSDQIKTDPWTEEEEMKLVEAHIHMENKWASIARKIEGRSENAIKNHWHATKRKLEMEINGKRKQTKFSRNQSTVLENYMKSYYAKKATQGSTSFEIQHGEGSSAESTGLDSFFDGLFEGGEVGSMFSHDDNMVMNHQNQCLSPDIDFDLMEMVVGANADDNNFSI